MEDLPFYDDLGESLANNNMFDRTSFRLESISSEPVVVEPMERPQRTRTQKQVMFHRFPSCSYLKTAVGRIRSPPLQSSARTRQINLEEATRWYHIR